MWIERLNKKPFRGRFSNWLHPIGKLLFLCYIRFFTEKAIALSENNRNFMPDSRPKCLSSKTYLLIFPVELPHHKRIIELYPTLMSLRLGADLTIECWRLW